MPRVYIAGPLFSEGERQYNARLNRFLKGLGYGTFLPQEDGYHFSELLDTGASELEAAARIFLMDVEKLNESDVVVFVMDGRVPDEGACVEIGMAYALGKECIGLKTDSRSLVSSFDNPMILGALRNRVARNFDELKNMLIIASRAKSEEVPCIVLA